MGRLEELQLFNEIWRSQTKVREHKLRYQWRRFLQQRDAEIQSLGEIAALAQSVDDGAYSDERVLKNAYELMVDWE